MAEKILHLSRPPALRGGDGAPRDAANLLAWRASPAAATRGLCARYVIHSFGDDACLGVTRGRFGAI